MNITVSLTPGVVFAVTWFVGAFITALLLRIPKCLNNPNSWDVSMDNFIKIVLSIVWPVTFPVWIVGIVGWFVFCKIPELLIRR